MEAWEVALDRSDSLCPGFLPHLRRSGPPAAQGAGVLQGSGAGAEGMLPPGRRAREPVERYHCKFSLSSPGIWGPMGCGAQK